MEQTRSIHVKYVILFMLIQLIGAVFFQTISLFIERFPYEVLRAIYIVFTLYLLNHWKIGLKEDESLISKYTDQIKNKEFIICFLISVLGFILTNQFLVNQRYASSLSEAVFFLYDNFLMAAVYEEIIYRGCIFDELKKRYAILICMILTGILFSFLHFPQQMIYRGGIQIQLVVLGTLKGMFLCCVVLVSKNIFITSCFHFNTGYLGDFVGLLVLLPYFLWKANRIIFIESDSKSQKSI